MNKYNSKTLYSGNLIKEENGKKIVVKENMYLMYDEISDSFYSYTDTFNYYLDLAFSNLTEKQRRQYEEIINTYKYNYIPTGIEGEEYIDEASITVILNEDKQKRK